MKKNNHIVYAIIAIAAIALFLWMRHSSSQPGELDMFAQCLVDKGAVMYGTWWCPHCQDQKKEFGRSWKLLQEQGGYVECSTADRTQTEYCFQQGIESYPTWRFEDDTEIFGAVSFYTLGQKAGCSEFLPDTSEFSDTI